MQDNLELLLVEFLVSNAGVLFAKLPMPLPTLWAMLCEHGIVIATKTLEKYASSLAAYLPSHFVLFQVHERDSTYGSRLYLSFYDPVILTRWAAKLSSQSLTPQDVTSGAHAKVGFAAINELPDLGSATPAALGAWQDMLLGFVGAQNSYWSRFKRELEDLTIAETQYQRLIREQILLDFDHVQCAQLCPNPKRSECIYKGHLECIRKIHFEKVVARVTDESLGDCSYLDTCFKGKGCRYVHYQIVDPDRMRGRTSSKLNLLKERGNQLRGADKAARVERNISNDSGTLRPPQWLECDIRQLDLKLLGQFSVIIADPPWDIHMNGHVQLPFEVITDDDILAFNIADIQTEGIFFLWVTGRALDIGRNCMKKWGYDHVEEIIWCKTNQLGRTICTGRTGHWLNHTKEHVLMGVKGNPAWLAKRVDIDTIVSTTREKSRKPDELYAIAERLTGTTSRKLELFGRDHNLRPGWLSMCANLSDVANTAVGTQLEGMNIVEEDLALRLRHWKSSLQFK